jgi:hypothetical protein
VGGLSHPVVRAFDPDIGMRWQRSLDDIHSIGFKVTNDGRTLVQRIDPASGANFLRSMVRWDPDHILMQYELHLPGDPPESREFHAVDSRLLHLDTGDEVARSLLIPLLAAAQGDRYVIIENLPYARALLMQRKSPS